VLALTFVVVAGRAFAADGDVPPPHVWRQAPGAPLTDADIENLARDVGYQAGRLQPGEAAGPGTFTGDTRAVREGAEDTARDLRNLDRARRGLPTQPTPERTGPGYTNERNLDVVTPRGDRDFRRQLEANGLVYVDAIDNRQTGFQAILVKDAHNPQHHYAIFRGTEADTYRENVKDGAADLNRYGVGREQYETDRARLRQWADVARNDKGAALTLTGHSLGGAIAQRFVVDHPDAVHRVVTFNTAAIDRQTLDRASEAALSKVEVTHYVQRDDPVSAGSGDGFVRGKLKLVSGGKTEDWRSFGQHRATHLQPDSGTTIEDADLDEYQWNRLREQVRRLPGPSDVAEGAAIAKDKLRHAKDRAFDKALDVGDRASDTATDLVDRGIQAGEALTDSVAGDSASDRDRRQGDARLAAYARALARGDIRLRDGVKPSDLADAVRDNGPRPGGLEDLVDRDYAPLRARYDAAVGALESCKPDVAEGALVAVAADSGGRTDSVYAALAQLSQATLARARAVRGELDAALGALAEAARAMPCGPEACVQALNRIRFAATPAPCATALQAKADALRAQAEQRQSVLATMRSQLLEGQTGVKSCRFAAAALAASDPVFSEAGSCPAERAMATSAQIVAASARRLETATDVFQERIASAKVALGAGRLDDARAAARQVVDAIGRLPGQQGCFADERAGAQSVLAQVATRDAVPPPRASASADETPARAPDAPAPPRPRARPEPREPAPRRDVERPPSTARSAAEPREPERENPMDVLLRHLQTAVDAQQRAQQAPPSSRDREPRSGGTERQVARTTPPAPDPQVEQERQRQARLRLEAELKKRGDKLVALEKSIAQLEQANTSHRATIECMKVGREKFKNTQADCRGRWMMTTHGYVIAQREGFIQDNEAEIRRSRQAISDLRREIRELENRR
jgi:pimeloyl-ACP methyl ester carboxylesterase